MFNFGSGPVQRVGRRGFQVAARLGGVVDHRLGLSRRANAAAERHAAPIYEITSSRHVHLTFDDGPSPGFTDAICDLLEAGGHQATFFFTGCNVERHPDLVRRVSAGGHGVGSHSFGHLPQWERSGPRILLDYARGHRAVQQSLGSKPTLFRPPYGHHDWRSALFTKGLRLRQFGWTNEAEDWKPGVTTASIVADLEDAIQPGAVVLLHDAIVDNPAAYDRSATVAAVGELVKVLNQRNLVSRPLAGR